MYILKNMTNIAFILSFSVSTLYASLSDYQVESKAVWLRALPQDGNRPQIIKEFFSQKEVSVFDVSTSNITDGDIPSISAGLIDREKSGQGKIEIKILDLSCEEITKKGIGDLLHLFQYGDNNVYPDVRHTILKVSIEVTEKLLEKWAREYPHVFSGGLRILD